MTNTDIEKSYRCWSSNLPRLQTFLERAGRRAARLGLPPITLELGEEQMELVKSGVAGKVYRGYRIVTVRGQTPRLAGWAFLATLQHVVDDNGEAKAVIRAVPTADAMELPRWFRDASSSNCDHCHTARVRNDTFCVRNLETGEWKQVGRNCLQDFCGGIDPHAVAAAAEIWAELDELGSGLGGDDDDFGFGRTDAVGLENFLAFVTANIRVNGWTSRKLARERGGQATADTTLDIMFEKDEVEQDRAREAGLYPTAADVAVAEAALTRARKQLVGKDGLNDYLYNLSVVVGSSSCGLRLCGIAASLIPWYQREIGHDEQLRLEREGSLDGWMGEVGKREHFLLRCIGYQSWEGQFGTTHLYRLADAQGRRATWFASAHQPEFEDVEDGGLARVEGEEGPRYFLVLATVKKHDTYKGQKQTILSRAVIFTGEARRLEEEKLAKAKAKAEKKATKAKAQGQLQLQGEAVPA